MKTRLGYGFLLSGIAAGTCTSDNFLGPAILAAAFSIIGLILIACDTKYGKK